jgi:hypothetical protein
MVVLAVDQMVVLVARAQLGLVSRATSLAAAAAEALAPAPRFDIPAAAAGVAIAPQHLHQRSQNLLRQDQRLYGKLVLVEILEVMGATLLAAPVPPAKFNSWWHDG